MKPLAIALVAAALLVMLGTFVLPWFTAGNVTITGRGLATMCNAGAACVTRSTDGLGYDSTWLGLVGALKIAAGLGVIACGGTAAMAQAKRAQLGEGTTAIKKGHVAFAMVIAAGITIGALAMKPGDVTYAVGGIVAMVGYLIGVVGLVLVKAEPAPAATAAK